MSHQSALLHSLTLPNGTVLPNRIAKAATQENLADDDHQPGDRMLRLYSRWSAAGAGLIITGNVMIDGTAMTGSADIVLDALQPLEPFRAWAATARPSGGQVWLQLSHPGRQVYSNLGQPTVAPSPVALKLGRLSPLFFSTPKELSAQEIERIVQSFARSASMAEQAGFDGVELHAAHGYLISQFLSPLTNLRNDRWGGSLEKRATFLIEIIKAIRLLVSPKFSLGVKLNSTDFQKGGFQVEDASAVVGFLNSLDVDLIEISGGSYESPTGMNVNKADSTLRREAYYIDFAREISRTAKMPIMVTGGILDRSTAELALEGGGSHAGVSMVGIATAMVFEPDLPRRWLAGFDATVELPCSPSRPRIVSILVEAALAREQIRRLGRSERTRLAGPALLHATRDWRHGQKSNCNYRRWISSRT
ncbi:NADH:flavin oxidoreductase/NADH oxidase family protein [Devosia sp. SL43]|uniref:NADH:flavin oxidoreductase/NADH oxidase family protein n=1 Tax=Devosia sp. SL43 TaxID=2806348 RepID=UPI001F46FCD6|nr:NADH:flavin oxidoreductase/NADH oxidase family protein [Devosia sp. SL43]UJW85551.1 NADH:flavin oxidoreductase/NADH oxidase family protein [Devosia sp. SL43]